MLKFTMMLFTSFMLHLFFSLANAQTVKEALAKNDTLAAMQLIKQGADKYNYDSVWGSHNLSTAVRYGNNPERVGFLLRQGLDPNKYKTSKGRSALHIACAYYACLNTITLLVDYGADINAKTIDGVTPLMLAAQNAKTEVVAYLLSKGANAALKDAKGKTALDYALISRDDAETKKWLPCPIDKAATIELLKN